MSHVSKKRSRDPEVAIVEKRTKFVDTFEELILNGVDADDLLAELEGLRADLRAEADDSLQCVDTRTCWGCRGNQPNQAAHMAPGGCLFSESDDDDS